MHREEKKEENKIKVKLTLSFYFSSPAEIQLCNSRKKKKKKGGGGGGVGVKPVNGWSVTMQAPRLWDTSRSSYLEEASDAIPADWTFATGPLLGVP
jgi:uncharacterized spore protein YtfJ